MLRSKICSAAFLLITILVLKMPDAHARGDECWYPDNTGLDGDAINAKNACASGMGIAFKHTFVCLPVTPNAVYTWEAIEAVLRTKKITLSQREPMSIYQRNTEGMAFSYTQDCKDGRARTTDHKGGCQDFNLNGKNIPNHERLKFIHVGKSASECLKNAESFNAKHGQPKPVIQSASSSGVKTLGGAAAGAGSALNKNISGTRQMTNESNQN